MYPCNQLYLAANSSRNSCIYFPPIPESTNFASLNPHDNLDKSKDLQFKQEITATTANRSIGIGPCIASGTIIGNIPQAVQHQEISGSRVNVPRKNGKNKKTMFSASQLVKLQATFSQSQYITAQMRRSLAQQLSLSEESVKNWFKNRRAKWRKEQLRSIHPDCLVSVQYFSHVPYPRGALMLTYGGHPAHITSQGTLTYQ